MRTFVYLIIVFLSGLFISSTSPKLEKSRVTNKQSTLEVLIENGEFDEINVNLDKLTDIQIQWMIDTLFTSDSIPLDFVTDLKIHLAQRTAQTQISEYTANELYNSWNIEKANHFFNLAFELLKREFGLSYKDATPIINRFIKESKVAI